MREEFNEGNAFCKKITYNADEDPKSVLSQFRNDYYPRIAVTVDMIATGTDVKPLECLIFLRDVKSKNYFEQMKGRGTRVISLDDLRKVTPSARYTKDHFVIIDAVGVTSSLKTDSRPLDREPGVSLKDLLAAVAVGAKDESLFTSLASRLLRLEKQLTDKEKEQFAVKSQGRSIKQVAKALLDAYDPDYIEEKARQKHNLPEGQQPEPFQLAAVAEELRRAAASAFNGELNTYVENVRKAHDQIIDAVNIDVLEFAGWDGQSRDKATELVRDFKAYIEAHQDEITALQIFYNQPYRRREVTYAMIKDLLEKLKLEKPTLAPVRIWQAYEQLDAVSCGNPKNELVALVSLVRRVLDIDAALTPYDRTVDRNFQDWVFRKQAGAAPKFTPEQMDWLRMIKDHIAMSFHLEREDLDYAPFDAQGGLGRMWQLFGDKTDEIIAELNEGLVA